MASARKTTIDKEPSASATSRILAIDIGGRLKSAVLSFDGEILTDENASRLPIR